MAEKKKPKIGLVIGAGGIKATAAIGLYKLLQQHQISVDLVAGCSGGGVIAALIAQGIEAASIESTILKMWANKQDISYRSFLQIIAPGLIGGFRKDFAMVKDDQIIQALRTGFGEITMQELPIPLYLIGSDMLTGEKIVIHEGDLVTAVRASLGIPAILGAIEAQGRWLLDGGLVDPLPIDVAIRENCDLIIAMGFENPFSHEVNSFPNYVLQVINILMNSLTKSQIAFYNAVHHAEMVLIWQQFKTPVGVFEVDALPQIIAAGETEARKHLPYILNVIKESQS